MQAKALDSSVNYSVFWRERYIERKRARSGGAHGTCRGNQGRWGGGLCGEKAAEQGLVWKGMARVVDNIIGLF